MIALLAAAPALPASPARPLPRHGFAGVNIGAWDAQADTPGVARLLRLAGVTALRWPGGSTADGFDWTAPIATDAPRLAHLAAGVGAEVTVTANYGTGTPQMAAALAAYCNASPSSRLTIGRDAAGRDWRTAGYWAAIRASRPLHRDDGLNHLRAGHPEPYGFRNWEIGNECYGAWERDSHRPAHDPVVYALFAIEAIRLMRRVAPRLQVGVVLMDAPIPGAADYQESARDPRTDRVATDWNGIVLSTLSTHGIAPDFVSIHHYAQAPGGESDAILLRDPAIWPAMIGALRTELADYYPGAGAGIKIACTECNSVSFNPGPQTTGGANALYYAAAARAAQSLGVENFIWWDLHNGPSAAGHDTRSPLNRFPYGDYGILGWGARLNQPYPVYYAIRRFAAGR